MASKSETPPPDAADELTELNRRVADAAAAATTAEARAKHSSQSAG